MSRVAVPPAELAASKAPLALAFERLTGTSPRTMSAIVVVGGEDPFKRIDLRKHMDPAGDPGGR